MEITWELDSIRTLDSPRLDLIFLCFVVFFNLLKYALQIFKPSKAHSFDWESFVICLSTQGQRLPGATRVRAPDPQIPSLMYLYV